MLLASLSFGQISITAIGTPYNENFDSMGATGTTFVTGWTASRAAGSGTLNATLTMAATDGAANSGNVYNTGTATAGERSFGTLGSGTTAPAFGASFTNNTGSTVSAVAVSAVVEQWRTGSDAAANEIVAFAYSLDATSLSSGTWTNVTALNLLEKLTTTTAAVAVDGNLVANQSNISSNITGLTWANGATLWIRWTDVNEAGSDGIYSIDNFVFNATTALSIKQNEILGLNMYPNPVSNGNLYISTDSNSAKSVEIYDILGKQVLNAKVSNNAVNVSNLKGGAYIVKINEEGKTATRKLIIE